MQYIKKTREVPLHTVAQTVLLNLKMKFYEVLLTSIYKQLCLLLILLFLINKKIFFSMLSCFLIKRKQNMWCYSVNWSQWFQCSEDPPHKHIIYYKGEENNSKANSSNTFCKRVYKYWLLFNFLLLCTFSHNILLFCTIALFFITFIVGSSSLLTLDQSKSKLDQVGTRLSLERLADTNLHICRDPQYQTIQLRTPDQLA